MLQWFKKHPEFLQKESLSLSSDSNYKQAHQCRDNLFISHGDMVVRLNETHLFSILIIYSDATPYLLPFIFPLKRKFTNTEIEELAVLSIGKAVEKIQPDISFYYELRHQNSSGVLCIVEREDLDNTNTFVGITQILQRVRDWYAGHITKQYPPEGEEVEFCAHFNFIDKENRLLYPEYFLNLQLTEGDCYAALYNFIPKHKYFLNDVYIYIGVFMDGIGKSGLFEQVSVSLAPGLQHEKLKNSQDLYTNPDIVNKLIEERNLLKAAWFHIEKEPSPFHSFSDLIIIIGNGDYKRGMKRLVAHHLNSFKQIPDSFFLAIRFLNRKGFVEFQLFKIYQDTTLPPFVIQQTEEDRLRCIFGRFNKVEAIECEKLTETTFHQRNSKRADYEIMKNASVNFFGVGAIGSELADCMAKAGTGKLALFDIQQMKAQNSVRHLAGINYVGEPKISAVADILHNHNPFVTIIPRPLNLYDLDPTLHLEDNSLTISSLGDDNVEGFINQQMVVANKTVFYIRALRGGKVGRIFRVIPGKDACFNCLSLYRNEGKDFIEIPEDPTFPTLKNECNNPIRPASAADLKFIASFASRLLIDHIQNEDVNCNHWIWSSEQIENTPIEKPYTFYTQNLPTHAKCSYCRSDKNISVSIGKESIVTMRKLIGQNPAIETGGVLAGRRDDKGNIFITDVSGPGPKAVQTDRRFEKDVEYCQYFLDELYKESKQKNVYVGEWHSHPSSNNRPSGTDINSLSEIAFQKNYLTDCPVMIIFSNDGTPSCTLHPAGKRFYFTDLISR